MRNQNRIHIVLGLISQVWNKFPDLRLGQLILNIINSQTTQVIDSSILPDDACTMLYNIEDDKLMEFIVKFYAPELTESIRSINQFLNKDSKLE